MKPAITIIGAGLVGSLWAVLLKKRGYDVTIFEKRPDIRIKTESEERSINLVITSRGLYGLSEAGLLDKAIALSVPIFGRAIHSKTGEVTNQPYGQDKECNFSISRSELNKFLITEAENSGVRIYFNAQLDSIDFSQKKLNFVNSQSQNYDLLFGTDGAGSQVRRELCKNFPSEFSDSIEWLEADYKELHMPACKDTTAPISKNALHIWPRGSHMMMALANLDNSFTMTLYMPKSQSQSKVSFENIQSRAEVENLFKQEFHDAIALMPHYIDEFEANPQGKLGTVRCSKWVYKNSVVLLGDAAHAIVPFFGQGMNCGFEDCTVFLEMLEQTQDNWAEALSKYESVQHPNADAIANMAIENWHEMKDKVGDEKFLLRKKIEGLLERQFPHIYKSRYGMVTYTRIPYAVTYEVGQIQDQLLTKYCDKISTPEELDLHRIESDLKSELEPFVLSHRLDLKTDPLVVQTRNRFK